MPRPMPAHEPRRPHHPRRPLHQPPPVTMDQVSAQATAVTAKFRNQINQWSTMETPPSPFERFVPEKLKGQCAWVGWGWRRRGEPTRGPASTPPAASHPFPPLPIPLQPSQGLCSLLSTRGLENQVRGGGAGGRAEGAARDGHDPDPTLTATPSQLQLPQGDGRRVPGHAAVHGGEETKGGEIRKKRTRKRTRKKLTPPPLPSPPQFILVSQIVFSCLLRDNDAGNELGKATCLLNPVRVLPIALTAGLAIFVPVSLSQPAITIGALVAGKISVMRAVAYVIAQVGGAATGTACAWRGGRAASTAQPPHRLASPPPPPPLISCLDGQERARSGQPGMKGGVERDRGPRERRRPTPPRRPPAPRGRAACSTRPTRLPCCCCRPGRLPRARARLPFADPSPPFFPDQCRRRLRCRLYGRMDPHIYAHVCGALRDGRGALPVDRAPPRARGRERSEVWAGAEPSHFLPHHPPPTTTSPLPSASPS